MRLKGRVRDLHSSFVTMMLGMKVTSLSFLVITSFGPCYRAQVNTGSSIQPKAYPFLEQKLSLVQTDARQFLQDSSIPNLPVLSVGFIFVWVWALFFFSRPTFLSRESEIEMSELFPSVFSIVRFPNNVCQGIYTDNQGKG